MARNEYELTGSHAAFAKASAFPEFTDADVRIIVTGSRQYQLHSSILKNVSPTLREQLRDEFAANLNKTATKRGVNVRFRLLMAPDPDASSSLGYVLEPAQLNEHGKPIDGSPVGLDLENGRVVSPIVLAFHAVFGAFYNIPIEFGNLEEDDMVGILTNATNVIEVAEYLRCVHIVTKPVEATLLSTGQVLHKSIANNPAAWLDFAYRVRSRSIFREALIHGVGKYNTPDMQKALHTLPKSVSDLVTKKAKALQEGMRMATLKIVSYYPTHIQREKTVGRADKDSIGRASYANDIMSWISLVVLRQWVTQAIARDETHHSHDMGKEFVDFIMEGGEKYLSKPELESFHNYFPMSNKGNTVLENRLSELKEHIKGFVKDFTKNETQLDVRRFPVQHFTCATVDVRDYPWDTSLGAPVASEDNDEEDGMGVYDSDSL